MLALKIIGGIVLFFCLLMLIPVGARAIYSEDGLFLWFKIACFSIRLVPMRKKGRPAKGDKPKKLKKDRQQKPKGGSAVRSEQTQEAKSPES